LKRNFNFYKDLTREEQVIFRIKEPKRKNGDLILLISNAIKSCIFSKVVKTESEGIEFFQKWYDETHSYDFVYVSQQQTETPQAEEGVIMEAQEDLKRVTFIETLETIESGIELFCICDNLNDFDDTAIEQWFDGLTHITIESDPANKLRIVSYDYEIWESGNVHLIIVVEADAVPQGECPAILE
jgi:hypothetical protein